MVLRCALVQFRLGPIRALEFKIEFGGYLTRLRRALIYLPQQQQTLSRAALKKELVALIRCKWQTYS